MVGVTYSEFRLKHDHRISLDPLWNWTNLWLLKCAAVDTVIYRLSTTISWDSFLISFERTMWRTYVITLGLSIQINRRNIFNCYMHQESRSQFYLFSNKDIRSLCVEYAITCLFYCSVHHAQTNLYLVLLMKLNHFFLLSSILERLFWRHIAYWEPRTPTANNSLVCHWTFVWHTKELKYDQCMGWALRKV